MLTVSPKLLIAFLSTVLLFVTTVTAQSRVCAVKMEVTRNGSETKINGAAATATNQTTKRLYRSTLKAGMPYFARLPEGAYRFAVSKTGYQKSVDELSVECSEQTISFGIELVKGSPAKIVRSSEVLKAPPLRRETSGGVEDDRGTTESTGRYETTPTVSGSGPRVVSGGVLNGKSTNLVKPAYPPAARAVKASGPVNVEVTIDEQGNVIRAVAVSGHPLLRAASVEAARQSKFPPTMLSGQPVKVVGVIVYNFVP
ncbi:MAG: energy transducer TonB [Acidobacteria bacterium]|nr:energy transducer TonB [Acidobacteriota bacterium]